MTNATSGETASPAVSNGISLVKPVYSLRLYQSNVIPNSPQLMEHLQSQMTRKSIIRPR